MSYDFEKHTQIIKFERPIKAQSSYKDMSIRMFNFVKVTKIGLMAIYQALLSEASWEQMITKFTVHDCTIQLGDHKLTILTYLSLFDTNGSEPFRIKVEPPVGNLASCLTIWLN
jgi:hypothetical protein